MEWENAVRLAKMRLEISGWTDNWDDVCENARDIMADSCRKIHLDYLNSYEWKQKREEILRRDNNLCQDCLKVFPDILKLFKKIKHEPINYKRKASEVHHTDYSLLHTSDEISSCVSLCSICHKLRHSTLSTSIMFWINKRIEQLMLGIYHEILEQPSYLKEAKEQHEDFINSLLIKKEEIGDGKKWT